MRLKLYRGKWAITWREEGRTKRRSLHTKNRGEAERRLKDYAREVVGGTVADIAAVYLKEKEKTAHSYGSMLTSWKAVEPTFGHLRPDQITRELCRQYITKRQKAGISDGTIRRDLGVLRAGLRYAKQDSRAAFAFPATPPPRERYLSRPEYEALLKACALPHVGLFVTLALATAGRAGAILSLTWDRVDFDKSIIRLADGRSGRKGRATVPMTDRAARALKQAYEARTSDYVIEWGGQPLKSIRRAFSAACARAGLGQDVTPHTLRHTAAVWLAEAGTPMPEITTYLGHSDSRVTERVYARFSPGYLRKASKALE